MLQGRRPEICPSGNLPPAQKAVCTIVILCSLSFVRRELHRTRSSLRETHIKLKSAHCRHGTCIWTPVQPPSCTVQHSGSRRLDDASTPVELRRCTPAYGERVNGPRDQTPCPHSLKPWGWLTLSMQIRSEQWYLEESGGLSWCRPAGVANTSGMCAAPQDAAAWQHDASPTGTWTVQRNRLRSH